MEHKGEKGKEEGSRVFSSFSDQSLERDSPLKDLAGLACFLRRLLTKHMPLPSLALEVVLVVERDEVTDDHSNFTSSSS